MRAKSETARPRMDDCGRVRPELQSRVRISWVTGVEGQKGGPLFEGKKGAAGFAMRRAKSIKGIGKKQCGGRLACQPRPVARAVTILMWRHFLRLSSHHSTHRAVLAKITIASDLFFFLLQRRSFVSTFRVQYLRKFSFA